MVLGGQPPGRVGRRGINDKTVYLNIGSFFNVKKIILLKLFLMSKRDKPVKYVDKN